MGKVYAFMGFLYSLIGNQYPFMGFPYPLIGNLYPVIGYLSPLKSNPYPLIDYPYRLLSYLFGALPHAVIFSRSPRLPYSSARINGSFQNC